MPALDPEQLFVDPRKVRDYLLALEHPEGGAKAAFFASLGFTGDRPWELAKALLELASREEAPEPLATPYGLKYVIDGAIRGAPVRSVWIVDPPAPQIRFVTAYPRRPGK